MMPASYPLQGNAKKFMREAVVANLRCMGSVRNAAPRSCHQALSWLASRCRVHEPLRPMRRGWGSVHPPSTVTPDLGPIHSAPTNATLSKLVGTSDRVCKRWACLAPLSRAPARVASLSLS